MIERSSPTHVFSNTAYQQLKSYCLEQEALGDKMLRIGQANQVFRLFRVGE